MKKYDLQWLMDFDCDIPVIIVRLGGERMKTKREKMAMVRLSQIEWDDIEAAALEDGVSVAEYVRRAAAERIANVRQARAFLGVTATNGYFDGKEKK